ncbi:class II fructose-bisphosphate aldolase [Campylobacter jejuni]|nr:class II fructose-bisphosphate aldolase [Campylobacter jejuni]
MGVLDIVKAGVISGDELNKIYDYAKAEGFAIPAVNVVGTDSINAVLEAAKKVNSPVIIQFSMVGQNFMQGKIVLMEKFWVQLVGLNMYIYLLKLMVYL